MTAEAFCGTCGDKLDPGARFCTGCGSPVLSQQPYVAEPRPIGPPAASSRSVVGTPLSAERLALIESKKKSTGMAIVLSFLIPGLGQFYVGDAGRGIGFFLIWIFCLFSIIFIIGLLLVPIWWIYGMYDANQQAIRYNVDLMRLA